MNIVVTDGAPLIQDDLSFDLFKEVGTLSVYDRSTREELIIRCAKADAIIINKSIIDKDLLSKLPHLKYIGVTATGTNIVDTEEAKKRGIAVTNVPSYSTDAVAQMVLAHILEHTNQVASYTNDVKSGVWQHSKDFCFLTHTISELSGKTLGIYGMGEIGMKIGAIGSAFGMKVIYNSRNRKEAADKKGYRYVSVEELFKESDFLSLNAPLNSESKHIVSKHTLSLMKRSAYLINTARGALVDEEALYSALKNKEISGAGLDVLEEEPPKVASPLFSLDNVTITPHASWGAVETRKRLLEVAFENLKAFSEGKEKNRIC